MCGVIEAFHNSVLFQGVWVGKLEGDAICFSPFVELVVDKFASSISVYDFYVVLSLCFNMFDKVNSKVRSFAFSF